MGKQLNVENSVISAKDDALFYNAMIQKNGVWQCGNKLDHEIISANQINIKDGMVTAQGRNYVIYPNEVDSLTIENGTANTNRYDLIVYEVSKTSEGEHVGLKVIKGTSSTSPVDPTLIQDDTLISGSKYQMPLYRVRLNGINIEGVDDLREYIVSFGNVSNPNLLINSDFRNPINLRGKTSYSSLVGSWDRVYSIDRWYVQYGVALERASGYIGLANLNDSEVAYFVQPFERTLPIDDYTITIKCNNVNGNITCFEQTLTNGVNIIKINCSLGDFTLVLGANASIDIEYIKLEKGSVATTHYVHNYEEELEKCKRFYDKETIYMSMMYSYSTTKFKFGGNYMKQKRVTPTIIAGNVFAYDGNNSQINPTAIEFKGTTSEGTMVDLTFSKALDDGASCVRATLTLDAEIY